MVVRTNDIIGIRIPEIYYRTLERLRICADNKRSPKGRPITNQWVYGNYRNTMEKLTEWLSDEMIRLGYGTEFVGMAFRIIGQTDRTVTLQTSDCPFDCYWTMLVIDDISDRYSFGGLLDQWQNDP